MPAVHSRTDALAAVCVSLGSLLGVLSSTRVSRDDEKTATMDSLNCTQAQFVGCTPGIEKLSSNDSSDALRDAKSDSTHGSRLSTLAHVLVRLTTRTAFFLMIQGKRRWQSACKGLERMHADMQNIGKVVV